MGHAGVVGARALACLSLALVGACTTGATVTITEENDASYLGGNSDKDYTQGLRMAWLYPTESAPELARTVADASSASNDTTEAIALILGHELYTPADITIDALQTQDRPYAAWLYTGIAVANVDRNDDDPVGDQLDSYELDLGVVGPMAQGKYVQTRVHEAIASPTPQGWETQLDNEVGVLFTFEHRRRLLDYGDVDSMEADLLGGAGFALGNVFTHAQINAIGRVGWRIPRNFGVNTIHRSAAEVGADELRDEISFYVYGGAEGRAVGRNIFLDGNSFRDSHSVNTIPLVGEVTGGLAVAYGNWRLTFSQVMRTAEFEERRRSQRFGSVSLVYQFGF